MAVKGKKKEFNIAGFMLSLVADVYILLILAGMPFYFTDGYGRIGTNKYQFFHGVTVAMGWVLLFVLAFVLLTEICERMGRSKRVRQLEKASVIAVIRKSMSRTDWFALGYGAALTLSYLHSAYRDETPYGDAWAGSNGWYMGFATQMMFLAIYFAVSRCWKPRKWILCAGMAASFIVFLLGYCNRFSIYPIKMEYANVSFISTIGNINWFCGYAVTVFFGGLYYWWAGEVKNPWIRAGLAAYCLVGFGALTTQGSSSGLMALIIMCVVLYLLSMRQGEKMQRFWLLMMLLGATCTMTLLLRYVFPERFLFQDTVTDIFTYSIVPVFVLMISVVMYLLVGTWNRKGKYPEKVFLWVGRVGVAAAVILTAIVVIAIAVNTLVPGSLGEMSEVSFLTFNENWGSYRGATYMAGIQVWMEQDISGKMVGVGPDCMAMYIHGGNNQELMAMVQKIWGESVMLTNAHCEWLTMLVNVGVLGLIGFAGMIVSAIVRFMKAGKTSAIAAACGMSILAYTVNNMVSFQQAMATTIMFVILGIGEAHMRREERKES